ncbi:MAG: type IV toxin-antitoxin system AbiEi family antitoxin domain-containing protein [Fibrobacter sp.]|nr:type IV toxin-antitoxin system AbiEi family antitoxin domain-containing protein [Fibrobacter sp.]
MLLDFLKSKFGPGKPIFTEDAEPLGLSAGNLRQQFKKLVDAGELSRFEPGVYFLPDPNHEYYPISSNMVAEYKYITDGDEIYGYYSGYTFANQLGLCLQVPYKEEIVTNNTTAIAREVKVGKIPFYIRRAKVAVTKENRNVLQLLDLLKDVEEYTDYCCEEEAPDIIRRHILRNKILRADVDKYIENFPLKTYKYIYDLRLYDVFA